MKKCGCCEAYSNKEAMLKMCWLKKECEEYYTQHKIHKDFTSISLWYKNTLVDRVFLKFENNIEWKWKKK